MPSTAEFRINTLKNFIIPDLIRAQSRCCFILESPHTTEITKRIPVCGATGKVMSEVLLKKSIPLGQLIYMDDDAAAGLSIMNACPIPLQATCYDAHDCHPQLVEISNARTLRTGSLIKDKENFKLHFKFGIGLEIVEDFRSRLQNCVTEESCRRFVVCGVAAQCIFELATRVFGKYRWSVPLDVFNHTIYVYYDNHPSELSGESVSKWKLPGHAQELLGFIDYNDAG